MENFYYRFQQDEKNEELNMFCIWINDGNDGVNRDANVVGLELRRRIEEIYNQFITLDGVDYDSIAISEAWEEYILASAELQVVNLFHLSNQEKKVFFINIYNMLTIHGIIEHGSPNNMFRRNWFFSSISYNIGGHRYTLNDIEHGILRGNKTPPGGIFRLIPSNDVRAPNILSDQLDPRIHFALVCGAKGCPPVRIYSIDEIDEQLNIATESYLENEIKVRNDKIFLPKLLQWYKSDFPKNNELLNWICDYVSDDLKEKIRELLNTHYDIAYNDYNWNLNAQSKM